MSLFPVVVSATSRLVPPAETVPPTVSAPPFAVTETAPSDVLVAPVRLTAPAFVMLTPPPEAV